MCSLLSNTHKARDATIINVDKDIYIYSPVIAPYKKFLIFIILNNIKTNITRYYK